MICLDLRRKGTWISGVLLCLAAYLIFFRPDSYDVARPRRGPAVKAVYATGVVEPVSGARIAPQVSGVLVKVLFDEREEVRTGQALAQLDDTEIKAEIASLEAARKTQSHDLERSESLFKRNVVSQQEYEHARKSLEETTAKVEAVRARLGYYTLKSPLDGRVLRREGEPGELISANTAVFWVGRPHPLRINADVDEENIPFVQVGQKVLIRTDAWPERSFPGTVAEITPRGDTTFKTYRVRILLPDDTELMIGMSTEVNIITGESQDAMLIPSSAVNDGQIWTVENGKLQLQQVETGARGDKYTEIKSGLHEDALVLLHPQPGLKNGLRARTVISED